jgi:hypothetical protein
MDFSFPPSPHQRHAILDKRKEGTDDTSSLVEIMDSNMADMQTAKAHGDHPAVYRIYNRMVQIMDEAGLARASDPGAD